MGMSVVATPLVRLRELLDSKAARDVARRVRDELEQAAQSRRLPWELETRATPGGASPERVSTIPFGVGVEQADPVAAAQVVPPQAHAVSSPTRPPPPRGPITVEDAPSILRRGPASDGERDLLARLLAVAVIRDWTADPLAVARLVRSVAWLAVKAQIDASPWLDEALGPDERAEFWSALGEHAIALANTNDDAKRLEATGAAWQVSRGRSPEARRVASATAALCKDEWLRSLLSAGAPAPVLIGELGPTPRGGFATFVMAVTLVLFLSRFIAVVGRYVFAYRRPARVWLGAEGIEIEQRTDFLGRSIKERRCVIPVASLSRITRETRYQNLGLYAGLASLVIGTFVGSGLLVDGVRVPGGSGTLILLGLAFCLIGIGLDLGLSLIDTRRANQCRLIVRPSRGRALCITRVDTELADVLLADVKRQLPRPPQMG